MKPRIGLRVVVVRKPLVFRQLTVPATFFNHRNLLQIGSGMNTRSVVEDRRGSEPRPLLIFGESLRWLRIHHYFIALTGFQWRKVADGVFDADVRELVLLELPPLGKLNQ